MQTSHRNRENIMSSRMLLWVERGLLILFFVLAIVSWVQVKRTRPVYAPVAPVPTDWMQSVPVLLQTGRPGVPHAELMLMLGRNHVHEGCIPTMAMRLRYRKSGYALHVGIRDADVLPAHLEFVLNGTRIARHESVNSLPIDSFEVAILGDMLNPGQDDILTIRNVGSGAWLGRMLLIPYGSARPLLPYVLPVFGALLLVAMTIRSGARGRKVLPYAFAVIMFCIYFYSLMTAKLMPLAGVAFSDCDELVYPFLANRMEYDLTKHMLCLPVIHMWLRVFCQLGWAQMVALNGAFSVVAAINIMVAYHLFSRLTRHARSGALLTICYAFSFSIWLYGSIYETFMFSSLMTNLFLVSWLGVRKFRWFSSPAVQSVLVILCGLAHPPLLVLLGAVLMRWLQRWRQRRVFLTVVGLVLLVFMTCGGFLAGRFLFRKAYIEEGMELATESVVDEVADAEKMISAYAGAHNMTWSNVGNMVFGQCFYAMGGRAPGFDWAGGWMAAGRYMRSIAGLIVCVCVVVLLLLSGWGCAIYRNRLWPTLFLVATVVFPYMGFLFWFNPSEMLLYSSPMLAIMLGWFAWAGRPVSPRVFDVLLGVLTCTVIVVNVAAITAFH
jgi:hypothetical protein